MKKILFTISNSHSTAYLAKEFQSLGFKVYMADMNKDALGKHFADKFFVLPSQKSDTYINELLEVIKTEAIDIVVPAGEYECLKIAKDKDRFLDSNCIPVITNIETLEVCLEKADSYDFLVENLDIPFMKYHIVESLEDLDKGLEKLQGCKKLSIKPSQGSGSRGFTIIDNKILDANEYFNNKSTFNTMSIYDLRKMLNESEVVPRLILMEMLDGIHHDSNMICRNGEIIFQSVKTREEAKIGTITKATIVNNSEIYEINKKIVKALNVTGYIMIQYIGNKLVEINPRWSTSLNTDDINEYGMAVDLALGKEISVSEEANTSYIGTKFLRYFDVLVYKDK